MPFPHEGATVLENIFHACQELCGRVRFTLQLILINDYIHDGMEGLGIMFPMSWISYFASSISKPATNSIHWSRSGFVREKDPSSACCVCSDPIFW